MQGIFEDSLGASLNNILEKLKSDKVFFVTGKGSFATSGAKEVCDRVFSNVEVMNFNDFSVNPKLEDIEAGIVSFRESDADLIVAIGGGSVIDVAKSINALSEVVEDIAAYVRGEKVIEKVALPLVAVPTTAGTGSEATHFAVVYIGKEKYSLAHASMLPDYVVLDPTLTQSQNPYLTACSGADAFAQALESMWSTGATEESKVYAKEAIGLVRKSFVQAVQKPDEESRKDMQQAAYLAGKAINISKTTASHAMSYALTSNYNIPHGHAVILTLGELLLFNSSVTVESVLDTRGFEYVMDTVDEVLEALSVSNTEEGSAYITSVMDDVGLQTRLRNFGIKESDIPALASSVSVERAKNNPRAFDESSAELILKNIF